jgi:O-antigen/teichoic acid export membrane protein
MSTIIRNVFIAIRKAGLALTIDTIQSLLKIPLAVLMVLFFHSFGIATAWGLTTAIGVLIALFVFLRRCEINYKPLPTFNFSIIGKLWHYSAGNYISSIFSMAPHWVLPIMVVNISGSAQNAYFYITWTISSLLHAVPVAASNSLFVEGSHSKDDLYLNIRKTLIFIYTLMIPIIIVVIILGNYILGLFGPEYATHGATLLKIMAFSSIFMSLNMIYHTVLRINNRIKELCILDAFQAIFILIGSYLILPVNGTLGIGYIWLGVKGILSLYVIVRLMSLFRKREYKSN